MIKQTLARFLEAEMDRKDFLKILGIGALAATGVTTMLKNVTQSFETTSGRNVATAAHYGSSVYGGIRTK